MITLNDCLKKQKHTQKNQVDEKQKTNGWNYNEHRKIK